ncbi:hypothetical protein LX16_3260 [Stackebrandtia albiflava]|uniref:Uncharacterized protein n=1 Tax=Stackebrandtia albiflava TaxID=406432 RepID=A0A562V3U9_9ACTN|nr:hypothetical protein [Stackebrandtia albiflava]TWJ12502.1 hypothetical protein LX16_3260 [Stackebrandtia albiflava]
MKQRSASNERFTESYGWPHILWAVRSFVFFPVLYWAGFEYVVPTELDGGPAVFVGVNLLNVLCGSISAVLGVRQSGRDIRDGFRRRVGQSSRGKAVWWLIGLLLKGAIFDWRPPTEPGEPLWKRRDHR